MKNRIASAVVCLAICFESSMVNAEAPPTVFNGKTLDAWDFTEGGWVIEDGTMTCKMETVKTKDGKQRTKGKGYIWTKHEYGDCTISLSYKLTEGANSGVFFRTDKDNPVQGGFEIQLLDDAGFQKVKGKKDRKNLNGAFYDAQAAKEHAVNPVGEWNQLKVTVLGMKLTIQINGETVNEADISKWDTPRKNPDGSENKFKTALKDLPQTGRIGFQNHGNVVWFKDITIEAK